jgi:hypothetical protein
LAGASLVFEDDVQSVNQTGNPTEQGQRDVDEQVNTTAALEEDTQRGQDNGKDNLADVAVEEGSVSFSVLRFLTVVALRLPSWSSLRPPSPSVRLAGGWAAARTTRMSRTTQRLTDRAAERGNKVEGSLRSGERHGGGFSRCDQTVLIRRGLLEVRSRMSYR